MLCEYIKSHHLNWERCLIPSIGTAALSWQCATKRRHDVYLHYHINLPFSFRFCYSLDVPLGSTIGDLFVLLMRIFFASYAVIPGQCSRELYVTVFEVICTIRLDSSRVSLLHLKTTITNIPLIFNSHSRKWQDNNGSVKWDQEMWCIAKQLNILPYNTAQFCYFRICINYILLGMLCKISMLSPNAMWHCIQLENNQGILH